MVEPARAIEGRIATNEAETGATRAADVLGATFPTESYSAPRAQLKVHTSDLHWYVYSRRCVTPLHQHFLFFVDVDKIGRKYESKVRDIEDLGTPARKPQDAVSQCILNNLLDAVFADDIVVLGRP
jgi:hypothetical protein